MWVSLLISPCTSFDLKHTMKDPTKEVPSCCFACPNSANSTPFDELYADALDHLTRAFISGSAGPKRAEKEGICSILTRATQSKTTVGMLYVCMVQYGGHQPQEATESLKCGQCKWKSKHLILLNFKSFKFAEPYVASGNHPGELKESTRAQIQYPLYILLLVGKQIKTTFPRWLYH